MHKTPDYLQSYHCNLIASTATNTPSINSSQQHQGTKYALTSILSYLTLSNSQKAFRLAIFSQIESGVFHQAIKYSHWQVAMKAKLFALEKNNTWSLCDISIRLDRWLRVTLNKKA